MGDVAPANLPKGVLELDGFLSRKSNMVMGFLKSWVENYFKISAANPGKLECYATQNVAEHLGTTVLTESVCYVNHKNPTFYLKPVGGKIFPLKTANTKMFNKWLATLKDHGSRMKTHILKGWLQKKGAMKGFSDRFFVLYDDRILIFKKIDDDDFVDNIELTADFDYELVTGEEAGGKNNVFRILCSQDQGAETHLIHAGGDKHAKDWLNALGELKASKAVKAVHLNSTKEGYLYKRGALDTQYKKRYFILFNDRLLYFRRKGDAKEAGSIDLPGGTAMQEMASENKMFPMSLLSTEDEGQRQFILAAETEAVRMDWYDTIWNIIKDKPTVKDEHSRFEGYLYKQQTAGGTSSANWKKRYFVLTDDLILYYGKKWDPEPAGRIVLTPDTICAEEDELSEQQQEKTRSESNAKDRHSTKLKNFSKKLTTAAFKTGGEREYIFSVTPSEDEDAKKHLLATISQQLRMTWLGLVESVVKQKRPKPGIQKVFPGKSVKEGYLWKASKSTVLNKRYCALFCDQLLYFSHKYSDIGEAHVLPIIGHQSVCKTSTSSTPVHALNFQESECEGVRTFLFVADDDPERDAWVTAVNRCIVQTNYRKYEESLKEGFLYKTGKTVGIWAKRYFCLLEDRLEYWKNFMDESPNGFINIGANSKVSEQPDNNRHCFGLGATENEGERIYKLAHVAAGGKTDWMESIENLIKSKVDNSFPDAFMQGYLMHEKHKRYFVLYEDVLHYFKKKEDTQPAFSVPIPPGAKAMEDEVSTDGFWVASSLDESCKRQFMQTLEGGVSRRRWLESLSKIINAKMITSVKFGSLKEGYLRRKNMMGKWIYRYYVLKENCIQVFKNKMDETPEKEQSFHAKYTTITGSDEDGWSLTIKILLGEEGELAAAMKDNETQGNVKSTKVTVKAEDQAERDAWVKVISEVLGIEVATLFGATLDSGVDRSQYECVPDIVVECVNFLMATEMLETEGMFRVPGSNEDITNYRKAYEKGDEVSLAGTHTVAGVLKLYFRMLLDPLVPFQFYDECMNIEQKEAEEEKVERLKVLLCETIPEINRCTLCVLLHLLRAVSDKAHKNKMHPKNCAMVFAPSLIRKPEGEQQENVDQMAAVRMMQKEMERSQNVIEVMINNLDKLFPVAYQPIKRRDELHSKTGMLSPRSRPASLGGSTPAMLRPQNPVYEARRASLMMVTQGMRRPTANVLQDKSEEEDEEQDLSDHDGRDSDDEDHPSLEKEVAQELQVAAAAAAERRASNINAFSSGPRHRRSTATAGSVVATELAPYTPEGGPPRHRRSTAGLTFEATSPPMGLSSPESTHSITEVDEAETPRPLKTATKAIGIQRADSDSDSDKPPPPPLAGPSRAARSTSLPVHDFSEDEDNPPPPWSPQLGSLPPGPPPPETPSSTVDQQGSQLFSPTNFSAFGHQGLPLSESTSNEVCIQGRTRSSDSPEAPQPDASDDDSEEPEQYVKPIMSRVYHKRDFSESDLPLNERPALQTPIDDSMSQAPVQRQPTLKESNVEDGDSDGDDEEGDSDA